MIYKNLPALITLIASLIVSIVTIIYRYDATKSLIIILGVAVGFFIVGSIIRSIFNKVLVVEEPEEEQEEENNEDENVEDAKTEEM